MVLTADTVARDLTDDYEILVIDDGSSDGSRELLQTLERQVSALRLIFHERNQGYGAALKSGFYNASKDLIFYTDGDAQYDVNELRLLFPHMIQDIDIVNGYKIKRHDPWYRIVIGWIYQHLMRWVFQLTIRDVDCDFRLMRRSIFEKVCLEHNSGVICVELVRKVQDAGFRFGEVGVHHYFRSYGRSQFFNFRRLLRVLYNLCGLWWQLRRAKKSGYEPGST